MDIHEFGKRILKYVPTLTPHQLTQIASVAISYKYDKTQCRNVLHAPNEREQPPRNKIKVPYRAQSGRDFFFKKS